MNETVTIALLVVFTIFTLTFVAFSFLVVQVLILLRSVLRDIHLASKTFRAVNAGAVSAGIGAIDGLLNIFKRR